MERNRLGQFVKGHAVIAGSEKGHFPKGYIPKVHFEKGHIPWILGKHHTEEARRKISISGYGRKYSAESNKKKGRSREQSSNWKGGQFTSQRGYVYILMPRHPYSRKDRYIKRATIVMEQYLGRYLIPPEFVHHINGIKDDDRIGNLQLCANQSEHRKLYSTHLTSSKPGIRQHAPLSTLTLPST